jgi:MHS family citrate/tricarballylate:H+ symporter-like MFS transporter
LRWGLSSLAKPGFTTRQAAVDGDLRFFEAGTRHVLMIGITIVLEQVFVMERRGELVTRLQVYEPNPAPGVAGIIRRVSRLASGPRGQLESGGSRFRMPPAFPLASDPAARHVGPCGPRREIAAQGASPMLDLASSARLPLMAAAPSKIGAVLRATGGNFLEMFDFFLFGIYAAPIGKAFFHTGTEFLDTLAAFAVFWVGAMMRPIGAVYLGAYVDSLGRRKGLIVTLAIMAAGTVIIALTPSYATIGIAAPVIVVIGRLAQGFSAGVELGGVSVYLAEIATPGTKGFVTSFQSASQQVAVFVAALIGYVISQTLAPEAISAWGWRIPFLIGCLIVPLIFGLRGSLQETPEFLAKKTHPAPPEIYRALIANAGIVALGMFMVMLTTVSFYFITVYTPDFGKSLNLSASDSLLVTLIIAVANFVWLPAGGALSDQFGRKPVLLAAALVMLVSAYPALTWLAAAPTFGKLIGVEMVFSLGYGLYNGAMVAALTEVVPPHVRASCFALAYSLAAALFGTSTPLISKIIIGHSGDRAAPAFWLMLAAACSIAAALALYSRAAVNARR